MSGPKPEPQSRDADELREALTQSAIAVAFQPLVALRFGDARSLEALARWEHPTRGVIAPSALLQLAERTGQATRLTFAVLRRVTRELPHWRSAAPQIRVAVNVAPDTMRDPAFPSLLETFLGASGCAGSWFELEVSERAFSQDPGPIRDAVAAARALGCRVTIDDFGSGYSSLGHLASVPISAVKIDRQFVSPMATDHRHEAIVRATIALGHDLGFEVIADGVEDRATGELLAAHGCDVAQGALVAEPLAAADVTAWLVAWAGGRAKLGSDLVPDGTLAAARASDRRVLVVDDDLAIAGMIRDILADQGFHVLVAANGAEALRVVEQTAIEVVLLDMNMPVLDGAGFVAAMRDRGLRIPIVVMTAGASAQRWAKELAADAYLSKPFDIDHLVEVTARLVATVARGLAAGPHRLPIRVVLADDHDGIRSALRSLLAIDSTIEVVGEAADGREALALVDRLRPDVLILDNQMPLLPGIEVARRLHARPERGPAIVFFSSEVMPADAAQARDRSVVKDAPAEDIVRAVVEAAGER